MASFFGEAWQLLSQQEECESCAQEDDTDDDKPRPHWQKVAVVTEVEAVRAFLSSFDLFVAAAWETGGAFSTIGSNFGLLAFVCEDFSFDSFALSTLNRLVRSCDRGALQVDHSAGFLCQTNIEDQKGDQNGPADFSFAYHFNQVVLRNRRSIYM